MRQSYSSIFYWIVKNGPFHAPYYMDDFGTLVPVNFKALAIFLRM